MLPARLGSRCRITGLLFQSRRVDRWQERSRGWSHPLCPIPRPRPWPLPRRHSRNCYLYAMTVPPGLVAATHSSLRMRLRCVYRETAPGLGPGDRHHRSSPSADRLSGERPAQIPAPSRHVQDLTASPDAQAAIFERVGSAHCRPESRFPAALASCGRHDDRTAFWSPIHHIP